MKLLSNYKTTTFNAGGGFKVDIVETDTMFEAWLWHDNYGIKDYMFGYREKDMNIENFIILVEYNIANSKRYYKNRYMEDLM